ncbi:MAG: RNHCP domain-containing protein [Tagaea sp.]|nr:RNHCP domain-containing protein [Tagaea sp.]
MSKRFARNVEDFVCARCGTAVTGDGYTNHCPKCLWSAHVDVHPGDRAETCGGAMRPIGVEEKGGKRALVHRCETCGAERRCKTSPRDDANALYALARASAEASIGRTRK